MMWVDDLAFPSRWPQKWRRLFLLTLPVSGPIWILLMTLIILGLLLTLVVIGPVVWAIEMWVGDEDGTC